MLNNYAKIAFNFNFKAPALLAAIIMPLLISSTLYAQEEVRRDTVPETLPDTSLRRGPLIISPDAVDEPIVYTAEGYMKTDLRSKKVSLVQGARVTYGSIELTADSIVLDMETGSVYATGRVDSTGRMTGLPVYKDGSEEFESKELTYNFKSKKGVIRNVTTEQEEVICRVLRRRGRRMERFMSTGASSQPVMQNIRISISPCQKPRFTLVKKLYPGLPIWWWQTYLCHWFFLLVFSRFSRGGPPVLSCQNTGRRHAADISCLMAGTILP